MTPHRMSVVQRLKVESEIARLHLMIYGRHVDPRTFRGKTPRELVQLRARLRHVRNKRGRA